MESSRLVTLTGAGGCGKTRLGLQVAAELLDGSGDGVWLVELAAVSDEDAVAPAICRRWGSPGSRAGQRWRPCWMRWPRRTMLIVLDNCEHLIDGCAKTADAILRRCPQVHLLATSREPLGIGGEAIYRVPPLSLPGPGDPTRWLPESSDAVALFVDRARAQGIGLAWTSRPPAGGVDLRAAGRDAAGHRAGCCPAALAVAGRPCTTAWTSGSAC